MSQVGHICLRPARPVLRGPANTEDIENIYNIYTEDPGSC